MKFVELCDILGNLEVQDVRIQERINCLAKYKEEDKLFTQFIKQKVDEMQTSLRQKDQNLNRRIDQI